MLCHRAPLLSVLISTSALLAAAASACSHAAAPPETAREAIAPLPEGVVQIGEASRPFVEVEAAGTSEAGTTLGAPAHVEFRDGAVLQVGAPLDGRVVAVHVRTGETVRAGAALVTLDSPEAAALRAAIETATVLRRAAHGALDRELRMLGQGIGIERDKLLAETALAEAEAEFARATAAAAFAGAGSGTSVIVRAPRGGTVLTRAASEGLTVAQGSEPLVEIGDPSALWVVADVFERDLPHVRQHAPVRVTLASVERPLDGRVTSIGAVVASGLRTAPVRIILSAADVALRPGMFGRAELAVAPARRGGVTLPVAAVLVKGKDTIVYIERSPTIYERRQVEVGPAANGRVPILSGVEPGDRVVVKGALLLDGAAEQLL